MEQDISNIGTHRTLVQRLVGIDGVLKGFVMTGLDFAKTAYVAPPPFVNCGACVSIALRCAHTLRC